MQLTTSARITIPRPREVVFDLACTASKFPKVFKPKGPIAGITKAEMLGGAAPAPGARRRIEMSDGVVLIETIAAYERPTRHAYGWSEGLGFPGNLLIRRADAVWLFTEEGNGTTVEWTYTFELTSPLAYLPGLAMRSQFRQWMESQLGNIAAVAVG